VITRLAALLGLSVSLLPAVPMGPAAAASFDCGKASTAYEHAICDNDDLSALDETLAVAYATAIGGLSKAATQTMRQNQRGWVAYAERACTVDAEPQTTPYTEDQHNCLESNLYNRIRELEQSRMDAGWRFYMDEAFIALKADQEESGSTYITVATKVYSSARIDGDSTTAKEFNIFAANLLASIKGNPEDDGGAADRISDVDTRAVLEVATSQRITLKTTDNYYAHGAAHGSYTVTYAHFLPAEGRALVVEDVFVKDGWIEPLAKLAHDALKTSLGESMWDDLEDSLKEWVADPARWDFSEQGLILQFQPYEVTAYAAGAPTVTIPWMQLEDWTSDNVYGIAYY
jgi:uncharacterized protein